MISFACANLEQNVEYCYITPRKNVWFHCHRPDLRRSATYIADKSSCRNKTRTEWWPIALLCKQLAWLLPPRLESQLHLLRFLYNLFLVGFQQVTTMAQIKESQCRIITVPAKGFTNRQVAVTALLGSLKRVYPQI